MCIRDRDGTKVDRSGAYMARCIAKNSVAAGLAEKCTVALAYAIGRAEPVAVDVDTHLTGTYSVSYTHLDVYKRQPLSTACWAARLTRTILPIITAVW